MLGTYDPDDVSESSFEHPPAPKLRMRATVVGIGLFPEEVVQDDTDRSALVLLTPAYTRTARPYVQYEWQGLVLRRGDRRRRRLQATLCRSARPGEPAVLPRHVGDDVPHPAGRATALHRAHALRGHRVPRLCRARRARARAVSCAPRTRNGRCSGRWVQRRRRRASPPRSALCGGARGSGAGRRAWPLPRRRPCRSGRSEWSRSRAGSTPTGRCWASARSCSSRSSAPSSGSPPGEPSPTGVPTAEQRRCARRSS